MLDLQIKDTENVRKSWHTVLRTMLQKERNCTENVRLTNKRYRKC